MRQMRTETAEHVLPGHPDKLCDAAVDAVVDFVRRGNDHVAGDPDGQCGLEAAAVFDSIHMTGRIAAREDLLAELDIPALVRETYRSAGYGVDAVGHMWGPDPDSLEVTTRFCRGDFVEGEREARHLSDDQAICIGYANAMAETNHLPPAHWLARKVGRALFDLRAERGAGQVGPDGKVLITVETDWELCRPVRASISLNHHEQSDSLFLRKFAEEALETACVGRATPPMLLNGAGMFISGGPNGDNGLSGKKLVVDGYGPTVPIGGGAWSGKDFHKVDRLGGMLAREMAKKAVLAGVGREVLVTLEYTPGCDRPAGISGVVDGVAVGEEVFARAGVGAMSNLEGWDRFGSPEVGLPELARWGHQGGENSW
jgi:S-adenosylmethionine synthetase